jgi:effector-binding domain-containing protein
MGFGEIHLLGVENNHSIMVRNDGTLIKNDNASHFSGDYGKILFPPRYDEVVKAYRSARDYAERHGIKIYNATRGGALEVFERVNFDEIAFANK